jgi:hypothetical protein
MSLTSEEITIVARDLILGNKPKITSKEADAFREALKVDIALAKKNGWTLELPFEWEVELEGGIDPD